LYIRSVKSRSNFMPIGNARSCESSQSSEILHLVDFIGWFFVRVCPVMSAPSNQYAPVTYFFRTSTALTVVSRPMQIVSTLYSSTSSNVPTLPICHIALAWSIMFWIARHIWISGIPRSELTSPFTCEAAFGVPSRTGESACTCSEDGRLAG
jgi:hypothetical protein